MDFRVADKISSYYNYINSGDKTSKKSTEVDFQRAIEKKKQVFPDGDMVIPQPPRQGNFQYDNSISNKSKEDMTLDEYKQWVANEMSQMPVSGWYQSTCVGGALTITEECFERMKTDPEWEKTVLGMVREMYSVNGIMGSKMIGFQVIGASEAECYGEGIPVDSSSGIGSATGKSWWEKRHEKMDELIKEQAAKAQERAVAKRKVQQEQWLQEQVESNNRMRQYFAERVGNGTDSIAIQAVSSGIGAYESAIDTFSVNMTSGKI